MSSFTVFKPPTTSQCIIFCDGTVTKRFLLQTAASLLQCCQDFRPREGRPNRGAGAILTARMKSWSDNGFTNALQSQAAFLYAFVESFVTDGSRNPLFMNEEGALLIIDALAAYQSWKTELVYLQKQENDAGTDDTSEFAKKIWTDHNDRFLALTK